LTCIKAFSWPAPSYAARFTELSGDTAMRKRSIVGAGIAFALAAVLAGYMTVARAQQYGGPWGMMGGGYGPGMMGPGMMGWGPWMMGRGMMGGPGMMGPWWGERAGEPKLTAEDVKTRFEQWLAWHGNSRLKVGGVKEKDANTIEVDIVTVDNSLVQRFAVDRRTGFYRPES
jgi:hypothetical protein